MKELCDLSRYALFNCAAAAMLAGCGGSQPPIGAPGAMPENVGFDRSAPSLSQLTLMKDSGRYLFVENVDSRHGLGNISVYAKGGGDPIKVVLNGVVKPNCVAIDSDGNLYVGNSGTPNKGPGAITVYQAGTAKLLRKITSGVSFPDALAFDASGNLYVANFGGNSVTVYASGTTHVLRKITNGVEKPQDLAFDSAGNLYVENYAASPKFLGSVTVYRAEGTKLLHTITDGISFPTGLALDDEGTVYVSNVSNQRRPGSYITAYESRTFGLLRTITQGLASPIGLAFQKDKLYALNSSGRSSQDKLGSVAMYPRGRSTPSRTITSGIHGPNTLLLDASGNMYVAQREGVCATVYKGLGLDLYTREY